MSEPLENLMARARRGALRADERRRLEIGLNSSLEAALLYQAGCGFEEERVVEPGDETLLQSLAAQAAERYRHAPRVKRRFGLVAIAALWFATSLAAAAGLGAALHAIRSLSQVGSEHARPGASRSIPQLVSSAAPVPPRQEAAVSTVVPAVARSSTPTVSNQTPHVTAQPTIQGVRPTEKSLFLRANQARSEGRIADAARDYQRLQHDYPKSREAALATISLGLIELQQGNAQSALMQFRRAHAEYPSPEALWGEAQALHELGRREQERQLLEELLGRYPGSPYAAAANKRLAVQD
jgi:TolA-binding protein